ATTAMTGKKASRPPTAPTRSKRRFDSRIDVMRRIAILYNTKNLRHLRVKLILPALTEATSPYWRPIKYSLFPPLGLATLAAFLTPDDEAVLVDEHVQNLEIDDRPDL